MIPEELPEIRSLKNLQKVAADIRKLEVSLPTFVGKGPQRVLVDLRDTLDECIASITPYIEAYEGQHRLHIEEQRRSSERLERALNGNQST